MDAFTSRFKYFIGFIIHLPPGEDITLDPLKIKRIRSIPLRVSVTSLATSMISRTYHDESGRSLAQPLLSLI
jgi:hypothetical protein